MRGWGRQFERGLGGRVGREGCKPVLGPPSKPLQGGERLATRDPLRGGGSHVIHGRGGGSD